MGIVPDQLGRYQVLPIMREGRPGYAVVDARQNLHEEFWFLTQSAAGERCDMMNQYDMVAASFRMAGLSQRRAA